MADNPYQAPQTRHEVTLLPVWQRHLSLPLIMFGALAVVGLAFAVAASIITMLELTNTPGLLMSDGELSGILIACLILAACASGFFLSGLALRRIMRWNLVAMIVVVITTTVAVYMSWWYPEAQRVVAQNKREISNARPAQFP